MGQFERWSGAAPALTPAGFFPLVDTDRAKVELTTRPPSLLLRARIVPICPARPPGCFASGRCSQDPLHGGLNPRRPRKSCGSKKWSGSAPPGRLCGCCPTPWQTSASSGGCRSATGLAGGGGGSGGCTCQMDDSRAPSPVTTVLQGTEGAPRSEDLLLAVMASPKAGGPTAPERGSATAGPRLRALGGRSLRDWG